MADWLISLPFLGLGVLVLALGLALLPVFQPPWPWLLSLLALVLQSARSGADDLAVGLALGFALTGALWSLAAVPGPNPQAIVGGESGLARGATGCAMRTLPVAGMQDGVAGCAIGAPRPSAWFGVVRGRGCARTLWPLFERAFLSRLSLLFASAAAGLMALDGRIARREGLVLGMAGFGALLLCRWQALLWQRLGHAVAQPAALVRRLARLLAALTLVSVGARLILIGALDLALVLDLGTQTIGLALGAGMGMVGFSQAVGRVHGAQPTGSGWDGVGATTLALTGVLGLAALSTPGGLDCRPIPPAAWWVLTATGALVWMSLGQGAGNEGRCV